MNQSITSSCFHMIMLLTIKGICAPAFESFFKYGRETIKERFSKLSAGTNISNSKLRRIVNRALSSYIKRQSALA